LRTSRGTSSAVPFRGGEELVVRGEDGCLTDGGRLPEADRDAVAAEVEGLVDQLAAKDVVVRGVYDVAALQSAYGGAIAPDAG